MSILISIACFFLGAASMAVLMSGKKPKVVLRTDEDVVELSDEVARRVMEVLDTYLCDDCRDVLLGR